MPDREWNAETWNQPGPWKHAGDDWSEGWGGPRAQWYGAIFPRVVRWLPAARLLEIAPGYGRWTQFLLGHANEYCGVEYSQLCVTECQKRFSAFMKARFVKNDGRSLVMIPDDCVDFCFSFDSLVHVELDVLAEYCQQIVKKLARDGVAFLHHSNALMGVDNVEELYPQRGRATTVSSRAIKEVIERNGGKVLIQEEINWQSQKRIDCLTTFSKNTSYSYLTYTLIENNNFMREMELISASIARYLQV